MNYPFKTKPMRHQLTALEHVHREFLALFMEQGTGKTKVTIDTAGILHSEGLLHTVVVAAPGGVHLNWAYEELPKHDWSGGDILVWSSNLSDKKKKALTERIKEPHNGKLLWLLINVEAIRTPAGMITVGHALKRGRSMFVVDESVAIKTHTAQQTKAAIALGDLAKYRRILTGTPIAKSPLDLFSQFRFLHKEALPYRSMTAFKGDFAIQRTEKFGSRCVERIVGFKNLDMLTALITPHAYRVMKADCLDLPEKTYQTEFVEMSDELRRDYARLKNDAMLELESAEKCGVITATTVVAQMTKLRQLLCGFLTDSEGHIYHTLTNPKMDRLLSVTEGLEGKVIIWTVFKESIRAITERLRKEYGHDSVVTYYGATSDEHRSEAVQRFQNDPTCRFFVANRTAAKGLTLTASSTCIYFDNDMSLEIRQQSEDRIHRHGQTKGCLYIDLIIPKTIDVRVATILRDKKQLSEEVLVRHWRDFFTDNPNEA